MRGAQLKQQDAPGQSAHGRQDRVCMLITVERLMPGQHVPEVEQRTDKGRSAGGNGALKRSIERIHDRAQLLRDYLCKHCAVG